MTARKRLIAKACIVAFALTAALSPALPAIAEAKSFHKNGFDDMPGGTVQVQAPLYIDDAEFSTTNPSIKRAPASQIKSTGGSVWGHTDAWAIYAQGLTSTSIPGSWTLKWKNVGTDADGEPVDVELTMSNMRTDTLRVSPVDFLLANSSKSSRSFTVDMLGYANPTSVTDGASMDLRLRILKHGTATPASGSYIMGFVDIDVPSSRPAFSEQVKLLGGFSDDVYTVPDNTLDVREDGTLFVGTASDDATFKSGFAVLGDPAGMTWRQAGVTGTDLFTDFGSYTVKASAGPGGSISPSGDVEVAWHTDRTFKATASKGYHLTGLTVDGKQIGAKASHTFSKVNGDHSIRAEFAPNAYRIAFDANGGTGSMSDQQMTYDKAAALKACTFTRTGYTFTGWTSAQDGSGAAYEDSQSVKNLTDEDGATVTLYAKWKANPYTVSFDANGGAGSMSDQKMTYDAAAALKGCGFSLEGHTFIGWGFKADDGKADLADRETVKNLTDENGGKVTLFAKWAADTYPVTFTDGLGTVLSTDETPWGSGAKAPDAPERVGYTFTGWDKSFSKVTGAMTVNAQWRPNAYKVKFSAAGGAGSMSDQQMEYDALEALDACAFTRAGYTFQGWSTERGGAIAYENRQNVRNLTDKDGGIVTLYAVWDEDADVRIAYAAADSAHCSVTRGSDEMAPATGEARGSAAKASPGYRFDGWYDVATGDKVCDEAELTPARGADGLWHAASYEARVAPISYTVTFDAAGGAGDMADQGFAYDELKDLFACTFTRAGYSFAGWATEPGGEVVYTDAQLVSNLADADGAVVALHTVWAEDADVTITYTAEDPAHSATSVASETVAPATGEAAGSVLTVSAGYEFESWTDWAGREVGDDPAFVPARGENGLWRTREYTARVAPISYAISYNANGGKGVMGNQQMTYDAPAALKGCAFERTGYTFKGWNTAPDGTGTHYKDKQEVVNLIAENAGTVTLFAQWEKHELTVTFYDGQGHVIGTSKVPYGGKATEPKVPGREGMEFSGWDTDFGCVTKNLDVTALWKTADTGEPVAGVTGSGGAQAPASDAPGKTATKPLDQTGGAGLAAAAALAAAGSAAALAVRARRNDREKED